MTSHAHALNLCLNCLELGGAAVEVGPEIGTQRDSWRRSLSLCEACRDALLAGNLTTFAARHVAKRTISREPA
jgi:hypothetical protein